MGNERFYVALTDNNGYEWIVFQSRPEQATADETGFVAVGNSFDTVEEAEDARKSLNLMFGK